MHLLKLYLNQNKTLFTLAVMLGCISGLVTAVLLALINGVIKSGSWTWPILSGFTALCLLRLFSGVGANVLLVHLCQNAVTKLRIEMATRIVQTPLDQLERIGRDRLVVCFTDDMMSVSTAITNLPYFLVNVVILVGCMVYLGWMSWFAATSIAICMGLGVATYLGPVILATGYLGRSRGYQDQMQKQFGSVVDGIKELKMYQRRSDDLLNTVLYDSVNRVRRYNLLGSSIYTIAANWNRLLFFLYVGAMLFVMPALDVVSTTMMVGYVLVLLYMMAPLEAIQNALPHMAKANIALYKIESLGLSLVTKLEANQDSCQCFDSWQRIRLCGTSYEYDSGEGDQHFRISCPSNSKNDRESHLGNELIFHRGEVVFLTGGNGSGKTTFIKLLTGLYMPSQGYIQVDGHKITQVNRQSYRQIFSTVFTDFYLFDSLYGFDLSQHDFKVQEYLELLQLDHVLKIYGNEFSTTSLSQGQRKRLALLVALVEDRPFYVLDECAANQDPEFTDFYYNTLIPKLRSRNKTVLVVSHDKHYFHLADRMLVLESGRFKVRIPDNRELGVVNQNM